MFTTTRTLISVIAALVIPASLALAVGFQLGESKQKLQLKYDASVYDHDTGRVTVTFSLEDEGRLKPIDSVDLSIPSKEKHTSGGYKSDLTVSMATRKEGNKQVARVHIRKDWAARAEILLKTGHLDGKQEAMTWYYHSVPLKEIVATAKPHKNIK